MFTPCGGPLPYGRGSDAALNAFPAPRVSVGILLLDQLKHRLLHDHPLRRARINHREVVRAS